MFLAPGTPDCGNEQKVQAEAQSVMNSQLQSLESPVQHPESRETMVKARDHTAGICIIFLFMRLCYLKKLHGLRNRMLVLI